MRCKSSVRVLIYNLLAALQIALFESKNLSKGVVVNIAIILDGKRAVVIDNVGAKIYTILPHLSVGRD